MTYNLIVPIDAPTLTAACHKAWEIVGKQCGLPFTVKAEPSPTPAPAGRTWTQSEIRDIEDGIVPACRRNDPEFIAAVKAKAEGKAQ
jgi:hypothetical protein